MSGDLELGATGTVTEVDGNRVYAFGHPVLQPRADAVPDDARLRPHACCRASLSSMKIASTGEVIGTVQQDRATTIAGTLGPGPALIPITLKLTSERGTKKTFNMAIVNDQLFTPLLAYSSILNTLTSYERQNGRPATSSAARPGEEARRRRRSKISSPATSLGRRGRLRRRRRSTSCCATPSRTWSSKG